MSLAMPDPASLVDAVVASIAANTEVTAWIPPDNISAYHGALDAIRTGRGVQAHPGITSVLPLVETPGALVMLSGVNRAAGPKTGNSSLRYGISVYYRTREDVLFDRMIRLLWNGAAGLSSFSQIITPYTANPMTVDIWPTWQRLTTPDGAELGLLAFGAYQEHFECA